MGGIGPWQARSHSQGGHLPKPPRLPRSTAAAAFWKHGSQNGKPSHVSSTPSSSSATPPNSTPPGPPPMPPEAAPAAAEAAAAALQASKVAAIEGGASPEAAKSAAWWSKLSNQWGAQVKKMGIDLNKAKANLKAPSLPSNMGKFKMDVDVMNPAINSIKSNWMQLPEPVRQAAPVVVTMLVLTGFTRYVHRDEMQRAEERHRELERDLQRVKARRDELEAEVTDLSSRIKRANQNLSIEMADALGKAAQAAATATAAAATAATACAYPEQPHQQGPWLDPPRKQRRKILQSVESLRNVTDGNSRRSEGGGNGSDGSSYGSKVRRVRDVPLERDIAAAAASGVREGRE